MEELVKKVKVKKKSIKNKNIVEFVEEPDNVYISLNPYSFKEPECIVSINQKVKKGELIAKGDGKNSFNVFSSISGTVNMIKKQSNYNSKNVTTFVAIKNDKLNSEKTYSLIPDTDTSKILKRLEFCSIFDKIDNSVDVYTKITKLKTFRFLVINGCDIIKYTKCSSTILKEYYMEIFKVAKLITQLNDNVNVIITYDSDNISSITNLFELVELNNNRRIIMKPITSIVRKLLPSKIVKKAIKVKILPNKNLEDYGILLLDSTTIFDIYNCIFEGIVPTNILVTIGGKSINKQGNYFIPDGMTIEDVTKACGGYTDNYDEIEEYKRNAIKNLNEELQIKNLIKEESDKYQKKQLINDLKEHKKNSRDNIYSKLKIMHKKYLNCLGKICILNRDNLYEVYSENENICRETFAVMYLSNSQINEERYEDE